MNRNLVEETRRLNNLKYRKPIRIVEAWFKERDIPIASDIWIYPEYPRTWEAVLGAWDRIWIMRFQNNKLTIKDIKPVKGINRNGTLMF